MNIVSHTETVSLTYMSCNRINLLRKNANESLSDLFKNPQIAKSFLVKTSTGTNCWNLWDMCHFTPLLNSLILQSLVSLFVAKIPEMAVYVNFSPDFKFKDFDFAILKTFVISSRFFFWKSAGGSWEKHEGSPRALTRIQKLIQYRNAVLVPAIPHAAEVLLPAPAFRHTCRRSFHWESNRKLNMYENCSALRAHISLRTWQDTTGCNRM